MITPNISKDSNNPPILEYRYMMEVCIDMINLASNEELYKCLYPQPNNFTFRNLA